MQTQCPKCKTQYIVTQAQLSIAKGRVRCSECQHIFDASLPILDKNNPQADIFLSDNKSDTSSAYKKDPIDQNNPLIYSELLNASNPTPTKRWPLVLLGIAMITLLLLQIGFLQREQLLRHNISGPLLAKLCGTSFCALDKPSDVQQLVLDDRQLYSHPNLSNALILTASFTNQANFEQNLPYIVVNMSNQHGQTVAQRVFTPKEYLSTEQMDITHIAPQERINFNLELTDPGAHAKGFELILITPPHSPAKPIQLNSANSSS